MRVAMLGTGIMGAGMAGDDRPMSDRPLPSAVRVAAALVAGVLVACSPTTDVASPTITPAVTPTTRDTSGPPTAAPAVTATTADVRPPLSVRPADVPAPAGPALATLVTDLSDLELQVLHQAQDAAGPDDVRRIGAQRYVGDGLVGFTEFATAMLSGVELPDDSLPVSDVELLAAGPGCVVASHVVGDQPPVVERLVATGTTADPDWRVERTLTADQLDPAHACPDG